MTRSITPLADLMSLWRLYRVMRHERFTIVHCHTPKAELLGQLAARLAGIPIVVDTFRGIYDRPGTGRLRRRLLLAMARVAASCADLVLCQSPRPWRRWFGTNSANPIESPFSATALTFAGSIASGCARANWNPSGRSRHRFITASRRLRWPSRP